MSEERMWWANVPFLYIYSFFLCNEDEKWELPGDVNIGIDWFLKLRRSKVHSCIFLLGPLFSVLLIFVTILTTLIKERKRAPYISFQIYYITLWLTHSCKLKGRQMDDKSLRDKIYIIMFYLSLSALKFLKEGMVAKALYILEILCSLLLFPLVTPVKLPLTLLSLLVCIRH